MYKRVNPNPKRKIVGDCVIRAISIAMNTEWEITYIRLAFFGYREADMPSANNVWGSFLIENGFKREVIPDKYPADYTVKDFCDDNPKGVYILATGSHVIAVIDGDYYDSWDSGDEVPIYYFKKEEKDE